MASRQAVRSRQAAGLTLMEVMFALLVLSFAVAALTQAIVSGQSHTYEAMHASRAITLAEAMIDEILSKPYDDPDGHITAGPDNGESKRDKFDCADDYDGYIETFGGIEDQAGELYPELYQDFSRSVTVDYVTETLDDLGGDHNGMSVTVTITDRNGRTWTLSRFIQEPT